MTIRQNTHTPTINAAYSDLRMAIELCAVECSKGRTLEMGDRIYPAYLWTLQLKLKDINLSEPEFTSKKAVSTRRNTSKAYSIISSKFLTYEEAHFTKPKQ